MKILILARDIPPYVCVPGSIQRVILLCKYLSDRGYEVGLVGSTRRTTNYEGPIWWNEELDTVKVFPLVPGKFLRYIDLIKEELRKNKSKKMNLYEYHDENNIIKQKRKIIKWSFKDVLSCKIIYNLARNIYNNLFIFGDDGIVEIPSLKKHLDEVFNEFKPDVVIVSTPPHSWLRVIPWIKANYPNYPIIIDFRDGWTSTGIFRAKSFIRRWWQDYIEKRVILSVNGLVFVSPGLKMFYFDKYNKNLPYSEIIFNGYNEKLWNSIDIERINIEFLIQKHRPCIIKYVGSIGFDIKSFRSPYNIFLALESCLAKGIISSNNFILSFTGFIGNIEVLNNFPLLKKIIRINNPVSPLDALKEMKTTDFLLLIHKKEEGAEEVLTGKLFDYLRAGKPILAVTTNNCGVKKFLDSLNIGTWLNINSSEDISKKFIKILKIFESDKWLGWSRKNTPSSSGIREYSREYQYQKFEKFIKKIVREKIKQRSLL